jgi:hypothetical protein
MQEFILSDSEGRGHRFESCRVRHAFRVYPLIGVSELGSAETSIGPVDMI